VTRRLRGAAARWFVVAFTLSVLVPLAATLHAQTPLSGHYPPGQSGIRGAATPPVGWAVTNFNRMFSNLAVKDAQGVTTSEVNELRYANITMVTWMTPWKVLGMSYGALAGIPFSTGNLRASAADVQSSSFGLGDVLLTPVSLYGIAPAYDYQFQLTVWTASGRFSPGGSENRGSGFQALVYSVGGTYYPRGARDEWSLSAVARFEQNFEQRETGVVPGDDVVVDWGVGKVLRAGSRPLDVGLSGFATWQLTQQAGGPAGIDTSPYRYFGVGPEANLAVTDAFALRLRLHWELGVRNSLEGNGVWVIANFRL
jgi:hypothetical protein